jgi:hypothetical protein
MSIEQYAGLIVSAITIVVAFAGSVRWLVKHYLYELKSNGGTSLRDQVNRLEERVDQIILLLIESNKPKPRKKTFVSKGEE